MISVKTQASYNEATAKQIKSSTPAPLVTIISPEVRKAFERSIRMAQEKKNESAEFSFELAKEESLLKLKRMEEKIQKLSEEFNKTSKKDWGYAASLNKINNDLEELVEFLN